LIAFEIEYLMAILRIHGNQNGADVGVDLILLETLPEIVQNQRLAQIGQQHLT
jgi:hypothetical protein